MASTQENIEIKHTLVDTTPRSEPCNDDSEWTICCSHTNRFALKYLIQVTMGSAVMIFAMCQIAWGDDEEDKAIFYSLISGTLGYFLPHPSMSDRS